MQELLFLAHRIPYPPDKGDKIRSWNFLRHLAERYRVHLGCFVDEARDWQFEKVLRDLCADCCLVPLDPRRARLRSLSGLLNQAPLTLPYYADRRLAFWVKDAIGRGSLARIFVYCSAMAQYVPAALTPSVRRIVDFCDLDSEKWLGYATRLSGPKGWMFAREGRRLRQAERDIAGAFDMTLLATEAEAEEFRRLAPLSRERIAVVSNGIDNAFFSPERSYDNPYAPQDIPLVFTGAMDYRPNIDAVTHFAREILPLVRLGLPAARFVIVGANPAPEVAALAAGQEIIVTGRVPDVRPYIAHARVVVAPLRLGRGVQNKVLEGMAMAKPVVAAPAALEGITARAGGEILGAAEPAAFAAAVCRAADPETGAAIGQAARQRILADYGWDKWLQRLDAIVDG